MKKIYLKNLLLSIFIVLGATVSFAQQLPNPGFEDWSGEKFDGNIQPASWNASNVSQVGFNFNFANREAGHTGEYSMMVQDKEVGAMGITETSPGYFSLGKPWAYLEGLSTGTATAGTEGGIQFTHRPDSMSVWIKRTGSNTDKEDFYLLYYAWSGTAKGNSYKNKNGSCTDTDRTNEESDIRLALDGNECGTSQPANQIAEGMWREQKTYGEWTNIRVPIYYFNDDIPSMMNIIFSASNYPNFRANSGLYAGNSLYVDDVELIYSSKIDKLYVREREWKAFDPNSAEEQIYSVGKATEIPAVFGIRGAGSITNARGTTVSLPGRRLSDKEFKIIQQGDIDGEPMIIQVTAEDGSSTTTYKIKFVSVASNNARLANIQVNGTTVAGFNAYLNTYNVSLPYGTTQVPVVSAIAQDNGATVIITQPTSTNGKATILVTAADGTTTNTYTLNFSVAQLSDNTLEAIYIDGQLVPGFMPTKNNYTISLPLGTNNTPEITWKSAYSEGAQTITLNKNTLSEGAQITVSAPAAQSTRTYKLTYKIEASTYAYLSDIRLDGQSLEGFSPNKTSYSITLPIGTTILPDITWTPGDPFQQVSITPSGVDGTTRIVVTAAAGNSVTYRLTFNTEKSANNTLLGIALDGTALETFHPDTLNYTITLPAGTTTIPAVTYTQGDEYQSVTVNTNTATRIVRIQVKAGNGTSRVYTLTFEVKKSANALLQMIYLNGDSLDNFIPEQLNYTVMLNEENIPDITVDQNPSQKVNITQPASFGTAIITVQPEVGTVVEYSIVFTSTSTPTIPDFATDSFPASADASLTAIYVNGELYQKDPTPQTYTYQLPWHTAQVPSVVPVAGSLGQNITVTCPGLNQTTTIHVVAADGKNSADYAIAFPVAKSNNTQLELIEIDGVEFDFDPSIRDYAITLPYGTTTLPTISFTKAEKEQKVELTTNNLHTPASILVTAEDGTRGTYTFSFNMAYAPYENTLQSIVVDNVGPLDLSAGTEHMVHLPYGTIDIAFTIVKRYPEQSITIINGGVSTPSTIRVKADDPAKADMVYTITPNIAQYDPAMLVDIQVNGEKIPQFQPNVYNYVASVTEKPTITWTTAAGAEVYDQSNAKETVLTVENDGYTHTYTITYYYPNDLTFDLGFENWTNYHNDDANKDGQYPNGWYAPINAITSGSKSSYEPQDCSSKSTDKTQGEAGAKLSTVYLLTSAEAMPGFLSLSQPTISVGAYYVFSHTATTLTYGSPITFRNTPDEIQLDYNLQAYNKLTGWRFIYNANNGKQINFAQEFTQLTKGQWYTLSQPITYAQDHEPTTLDILISTAQTDDLSSYYVGANGAQTKNRYTSTMYFDNLRLNYSSALSGLNVNGVDATIIGTDITATIDADSYGEPTLVFAHAVKDQMPVVTWTEENNGIRTATIHNYAEDGSYTTYTLTVTRPISNNTTCTYAVEGKDLTLVKSSPYQAISIQHEETRYVITVTAEDGSSATYYADIQSSTTPSTPTHVLSDAESFEYAPSSATLNGVMLENGILAYETTSPLDTIAYQATDTAYHIDVYGEAGSNHYCINRQASNNALLSAIYVDGTPLAEFYESTFTYQLTLSQLPNIDGIAADPNAQVQTALLRQDDTHYVVFIQVTAADGYTKQGYTVAITIRTLRSTALLSDIRANNISIDGFAPTTFDYHIDLLPGETMPAFKAITADGATAVASYTELGRLTTISYKVTSEDGMTNNTYNVVVEQLQSSICTLDAIYLDGTLLEGFHTNTHTYNVVLPYGTTQLPEITATVTDPAATLNIVVDNTNMYANIIVTAENNDQFTYSIYFTIAKNSDATLSGIFADGTLIVNFDAMMLDYTVNIPYGATVPTITATANDTNAKVQITAVDEYHYNILVTAEDGITTLTYTVTLVYLPSTNSTLLKIYIDGEPLAEFTPTDFEYAITLPYGATLPEVTWQVADEQQTVELTWNAQTAYLTVTAGDKSSISEYTIAFTNELSDNNYLLSITLNGEALATFHRDTLAYSITYPIGTDASQLVTTEQVVAIPEDPNAAVQVQEQGTTLVIIVTAANGNIRAYSIEQSIALSNEARLSMIYVDALPIEDFDPDIYEYVLRLAQGATTPIITATPIDTLYAEVELGMEKAHEDGSKLIEIDGIAQDGTRLTYSVYFTYANWSPTSDPIIGDCLFFPVEGAYNTYRAVTISLGVKCAIYTLNGALVTIMDVPVLDVNSVEVELNENGEQVIVEGSVPNDAIGADYIANTGEPFVYIFYNTKNKRIGKGGKFMSY